MQCSGTGKDRTFQKIFPLRTKIKMLLQASGNVEWIPTGKQTPLCFDSTTVQIPCKYWVLEIIVTGAATVVCRFWWL